MFLVEHWAVKFFLNISLVIIYIFTFGKNSLEKYLDGGVIISTKTIQTTEIDPPGMDISSNIFKLVPRNINTERIAYVILVN